MQPPRLVTCALALAASSYFLRADTVPVYRIDAFAGAYTLGDGGPATSAGLVQPEFARFDGAGNMYVSDLSNFRIRKISPDGTISTFAGNGTSSLPAEGSPALETGIGSVRAITVSPAGLLYFVSETAERPR